MTRFADLGEDLANIVCEFAFTCRYNAVFYSLKCYLQIMCFRVPEHLLKRRIYSPKYRRVLPNPLFVNRSRISGPIGTCSTGVRYTCCFGSDFRRSIVKTFGPRGRWHLRLTLDWRNVLEFVIYYRTLTLLPKCIKVLKPSLVPFVNIASGFPPLLRT